MKFKIFFYFLIIAKMTFAQDTGQVAVPGTKYSLVPPANFVIASNFGGFQNEATGSSIMITEIPAPYKTMVEGFTVDALKAKGMTLLKKETIKFNASEATLLNVKQPANNIVYLKQILLFGTDSTVVLVNGIYPETSKHIEEEIRKALLSIKFNSKQHNDPLEAVPFTINMTGTGFTLAKYMSGMLIYTVGGEIPTEKPMIMAGSLVGKVPVLHYKEYAVSRFRKLPGLESAEVTEEKELEIDGLMGYEITAYTGTKENREELSYQEMLFNEEGDYYIIFGKAKEDFQKNLKIFKSVSATFKQK